MASIFKPVTLEFKGVQKTIPADQVMTAIGLVENHISLSELTNSHGAPLAKLANGYAALLNFAGFRVTGESVYVSLFDKDQGKKSAADSAAGLMMLMVPPTNYTPPKKTVKQNKPRKKV